MQASQKPAQNITKWRRMRVSHGKHWEEILVSNLQCCLQRFVLWSHQSDSTSFHLDCTTAQWPKHQNKDNLQVTQKGSQTESEKALRQFCEQNLVRTKSKQSALTINSNITSAGRDMKKSDASGDAYWSMRLSRTNISCQFKYLTLLLMSIVTHIITQPAGPKDV